MSDQIPTGNNRNKIEFLEELINKQLLKHPMMRPANYIGQFDYQFTTSKSATPPTGVCYVYTDGVSEAIYDITQAKYATFDKQGLKSYTAFILTRQDNGILTSFTKNGGAWQGKGERMLSMGIDSWSTANDNLTFQVWNNAANIDSLDELDGHTQATNY